MKVSHVQLGAILLSNICAAAPLTNVCIPADYTATAALITLLAGCLMAADL